MAYFKSTAPGSGGGGSSTLAGLTDVNLSSPSNNEVLKYDSSSQKWVNAPDSGATYTEVTGTLTSGSTSITLQDASITTNSTIDIYTSDGTEWTDVTLATGSVIITFEAQSGDLGVKVRVS